MPTYNGKATAKGEAFTNTDPKSLVTSSATATATSSVSQNDADEVAKNTAQNVANSVAQNDANIISQMIEISTTNVKGQFSNLNTYYATPTDVGINSTFTGLISTPATGKYNSMILSFNKPIFSINTLNPSQIPPTSEQIIPGGYITGSYNVTYENLDLSLPLPEGAPVGTKSVAQGPRTSYCTIPLMSGGATLYKTVITNVQFYSSVEITEVTTAEDMNGSVLKIVILNKTMDNVSVDNKDSGVLNFYSGVYFNESYSNNGDFNYLNILFNNATIGGSFISIYPQNITASVG
jgi:hypothetical protein